MTDSLTIKLSKPISFSGETWAEISVRPAILADMLAADEVEGSASKQAAIYASICGVPFAAFTRLAAADYAKIVAEADAVAGNVSAPVPEATGAESQG